MSPIKNLVEDFGCRVGCVVTDNAFYVSKIRKLLEESKLNVMTSGCSAHILNMLAHDLEVPNVKDHVVYVVKYFRNNHYASARYHQKVCIFVWWG